uniref:Uncharacterized protein n=1 Tax=Strigamia maritima TaxID=126957 RepID=T1JIL2_STRMM
MLNTGKKESTRECETPGSTNDFVKKSSAYAPVSLNLMGMYLVKEHMNAHYKRIYNSAVDTRPPHSIQNRMKSAGGGYSRCSSRQSYVKSHDGNDERSGNVHFLDKVDKYLESVRDYASSPSTSVKNYNRNSSAHRIRENSRNGQSRVKYGYTEPANRKYSTCSKYEKRVVPALRIQRDLDHARWLKDQARKFRADQKLNELERCDKSLDDFVDDNLYDESERDLPNEEADYDDLVNLNSPMESVTSLRNCEMLAPISTTRIKSSNRFSSMRSLVKEQLEAEEEELRYLEFITDVTNDILLRGVYTDRALKQVFQYHINRRIDLNFNKMKNLLGKLQDDLGIPRFEKQFTPTYMEPTPKEKNIILRNPTRNELETVANNDSSVQSNLQKSIGNKKTSVHFSPKLENEQTSLNSIEDDPDTKVNELTVKDESELSEKATDLSEDELNEAVIKDKNNEDDADWELSQHLEGVLSVGTNEESSEEESFENDLEIDENDVMNYSDEDFCSSHSEN